MIARKIIKRLLGSFLAKTFCIQLKGNQFREGDILHAGKCKGNILILRKKVSIQRHGVFTRLYCVHNKNYKNKTLNRYRIRFYKWLAYKDLIC